MNRFITPFAIFCLALPALALNAEEIKDAAKKDRRGLSDCVFSRTINDWQVIDNRRLAVWTPGRKTPYVVELMRPASGLKFEHTLGFEDHNNDGRFCDYGGDSIVIGGRISERISIARVRRVEAEELKLLLAEAKEARKKPKATLPEPSDMKSEKPKSK